MTHMQRKIKRAVRRIEQLQNNSISLSGENRADFVTDTLTDLMHYCKKHRIDFNVRVLYAEMHFSAEKRGIP